MEIKSEIQVEYNEEENEAVFKSLGVNNNGFVKSSVGDNSIDFNVSSGSLGTFY
ncbi:MAG: hypothetical protein LBC39_06865 [Methanobrevibacter sp.]|jgi:hypothetical protein|nr:hypothetical protein [Candidatus Methanovirga aequatorialis]